MTLASVMTQPNETAQLVTAMSPVLEKFDRADLASALAALQVTPENADRLLRLEFLSNVLSKLEGSGELPSPTRHRLQQICNSPPLSNSHFARIEDPFECAFTQCISFFGGSYIVFTGGLAGSVLQTQSLLAALFKNDNQAIPVDLLRFAHQTSLAVLLVSNRIARKAGLNRATPPGQSRGGVVVPSATRMADLKNAVRCSTSELRSLFEQNGVDMSALELLSLDPRLAEEIEVADDSGPLSLRPMLNFGSEVVVAAPGLLLSALQNAILEYAQELGVLSLVADAYCERVWRNVVRYLGYLGNFRVDVPSMDPSGLDCHREAYFSLDVDKLIYVQLVTDPLEGFDPLHIGGWEIESRDALQKRAREAVNFSYSWDDPPNDTMTLLVLGSLGRPFMATFALDDDITLVLAPDELEVISEIDGNEPLRLYQYAQASNDVRERTAIVAWSQLDEYAIYRQNNYSYYLSDDGMPTMLNIVPGTGLPLRLEALEKWDWHAVPSHLRGYFTDVTRLEHGLKTPIYTTASPANIALLVEGLPRLVWVVTSDTMRYQLIPMPELVETVAYWIWQLTDVLKPTLDLLEDEPLVVEVSVCNPAQWAELGDLSWEDALARAGNDDPLAYECIPNDNRIQLEIRSSLLPLLSTADNSGERLLVDAILLAVRDLAASCGVDTDLDDHEPRSKGLDACCPLGPKKKLLLLHGGAHPQLDRRHLPRYRKVQEFEEQQLLTWVGGRLSESWPIGAVAPEQRESLLNSAVSELYDLLSRMVATFDGPRLLDWVVAHNEAVTRRLAHRQLTITTRVACYATHDEMVKQLAEEVPDANKVSLASRFLIELICARLPSGLRQPSVASYDRLIAAASLIFSFGTDSDLAHYGIADVKVSMLPSLRIGPTRGDYEVGRHAFQTSFSEAEIRYAAGRFSRHWNSEHNENGADEPLEDLDTAFQGEFGYGFLEFANLIGELISMASDAETAVSKRGYEALTEDLSNALQWDKSKAELAIASLIISPRADFLLPPAPFSRDDVYPWRFNRGLSYVRRPLLRVADEVWWGKRHLDVAGRKLLEVVLSGRLKDVSSPEMKTFIAKQRATETSRFNDLVAELCQGAGLIAKSRVRKIGRAVIGSPDADLGDMDVLAASESARQLLLIECKDLAVARTPAELSHELAALFTGLNGKDSTTTRQTKRAEWVSEHLDVVLSFLGLPLTHSYSVEAIVVVDEQLFTPYLAKSPIQVLSVHDFEHTFLTRFN